MGAPALEDTAARASEPLRMKQPGLTYAQVAAVAGAGVPSAAGTPGLLVRVSAFGQAKADCIVFASDTQSLAAAIASEAGAILAPEALAPFRDVRVLGVDDPRLRFALCARELRKLNTAERSEIDPSASVHPTAHLGARVRVGAGAVIAAGARLGDDVVIGSNATIAEGVALGHRVVVQAGAVLGGTGFGYVRDGRTGEYVLLPQQGALVIEDDVEIGANTTIDRGALEETRVGRGTKIDNLVHIGHNCRIGENVIIAAQVGISGSSTIGDGAVLAGQVGISDHCHIGPGAILGGQAGVYRGKTVAGPGEIFAGTPAEPLRDHMRGLAKLRELARLRRIR